MPIVNVQMFAGRDETQKGFLARGIADVMAEVTRTTKEGVHVTFDERSTANWAVGPRLWSTYTPPASDPEPAAYVEIFRVRIRSGCREVFLSWLRHSAFPAMAAFDGFLGATLLRDEEPDSFVYVRKWWDEAAKDAYLASARGAELTAEESEFVATLSESYAGEVVDIWGAPKP